MSWKPLSSDAHSEYFKRRSSSLRPYAELLLRLAKLPEADQVFGSWSHDLFFIGTVPSYSESDDTGSDTIVMIERLRGDHFRIRSRGDKASPNPGWYQEGQELKWGGKTQDARGEAAATVVGEILAEFIRNRAGGTP